MRAVAISIVAALTVAAVTEVASGAPSARLFRSPDYRVVAIDPPSGWEISASAPSSRLLASWTHHDGAKLTLASERSAITDAEKLYLQGKSVLEQQQGWTLGRVDRPQVGRLTIDATLEHGKRVARQLYIVEQGFAYVLTMVAPADQASLRERDFDDTVATMRLGAVTTK